MMRNQKAIAIKNICPTVKHEDGGVLVWCSRSAAGVEKLKIIEDIKYHSFM